MQLDVAMHMYVDMNAVYVSICIHYISIYILSLDRLTDVGLLLVIDDVIRVIFFYIKVDNFDQF